MKGFGTLFQKDNFTIINQLKALLFVVSGFVVGCFISHYLSGPLPYVLTQYNRKIKCVECVVK